MSDLALNTGSNTSLQNDVAAFLYDLFSAEDAALAHLDRWTQRRVSDENMAKIALVLEADDPREFCYQNLVREIDVEAEAGIYLVRIAAGRRELRELARDSGVSGLLHKNMKKIAPVIFPDELSESDQDMDIVWATIQARYDRAKIETAVSEMIMVHLMGKSDAVADMTDAMRSLLYSFHEDLARRITGLPRILNDRCTRELVTMVSELAERAGDFEIRVEAIRERAGTFKESP